MCNQLSNKKTFKSSLGRLVCRLLLPVEESSMEFSELLIKEHEPIRRAISVLEGMASDAVAALTETM
jgi:hypothetical protein